MRRLLLAGCLLAGLPHAAPAQEPWRAAEPDYAWSFPADHWTHPGFRTEWWYLTGIVRDTADPARRFGFQFTFFRVGLTADSLPYQSAWSTTDLIMGHASVSDLGAGRHAFSEILFRPNGLLGGFGVRGDTLIAWSRAPYGTDDRWTLSWNGAAFDVSVRDDAQGIGFAFTTTPAKPLVLQGPNGYSRKGDGPTAASLYYSFTRLRTTGTLTVDGVETPVAGESWMDKEFGSNQLAPGQLGWDWFSLRLDDGRDVMLYLLRSEGGGSYARGTVVAPDGTPTYLDPDAWSVSVTRRWRSERTGAEYPSGWRLALPELDLDVDIVPLLDAQENATALVPDLFYWEGAVEVRSREGARVGEGYVELTGYGTKARPAI